MATYQVFLLEQFHGQRTLAGYSPWGRKQLDRTEQRTLSLSKRIAVYLVAGLKHLIQESMSVFPELGFFFLIIYFNWRLITLQYCSGFCHTLT